MAVEYVAFLFCKIYGFDPVDIYPCVEIYVPEMVIADFTGYFSCVAVPVRQHYVIKIYSEIVYMERSFYGISDIRVSYFRYASSMLVLLLLVWLDVGSSALSNGIDVVYQWMAGLFLIMR